MPHCKILHVTFSLLLFICTSGTVVAQQITVATAANVQYVMQELKTAFEASTGIRVQVVAGSSGKLSAQIREGAPFDVFVSADMQYPEALYKAGFASDTPKVYARGVLVLWSANPAIQPGKDLGMLAQSPVKKIALANPKTAPYGTAAESAMRYYKVYDKVKDKLVYGESIAQASQFIATRSADIGFTAKSVVLSGEMKGKGRWVDVDAKSYSPILQGAVILKQGKEKNIDAANRFYSFLYSKTAQSILTKYGYLVP